MKSPLSFTLFVRENDYVGLVLLDFALRKHPDYHPATWAERADLLEAIVGWPVEPHTLQKRCICYRRKEQSRLLDDAFCRDICRLRKKMHLD